MATNTSFQKFPKDGTMELAVEKLVDGIINNKFNEDEIDFLSTEFRYNFPQKEKYGKATKLSLDNFSKETIENGIKEGLSKDHDLFLDMQNSGQIVLVPNVIYTNDSNTLLTEEVDRIYNNLLNGESPQFYDGVFDEYEAEDFYCGGTTLLKNLYNSDKFAKLRETDADVYEVTEAFLDIIKNEEPDMRDKLLQEFHDRLEEAYTSYLDAGGEELEYINKNNEEKATEILKSKGFLNDAETYLMLGTNTNWRGDNGINLKKVEDLEDMIKGVVPNGDYTIDITEKENVPYFEAMVYSHDVPTGSYCYLLPESQWDKLIGFDKDTKTFNKGYEFLDEFKKEYPVVEEIFHSRRKEIEMDLEAEKNPIVAKMKKVYDKYIYDNYYDNTIEKIEDSGIYKAWDEVQDFLAGKIVQGTQISKKDFKTCEELLIKFNPTLNSDKDICEYFKCACQEEIEYNKKNKANDVPR